MQSLTHAITLSFILLTALVMECGTFSFHRHRVSRQTFDESHLPHIRRCSYGPTYESVSTRDANAFRDSIKHVVVLVLENRAFDHVLGFLYDEEGASDIHVRYPDGVDADEMRKRYPPYFGLNFPRYYEADGSPNPPPNASTNPPRTENIMTSAYYSCKDLRDTSWNAYMPIHIYGNDEAFYNQSTWPAVDPGEVHAHAALQFYNKTINETDWWEEPQMNGHIRSYHDNLIEFNGQSIPPETIMQTLSLGLLPVFDAFAHDYAVCDEWYASVPTQTWANRLFIHGATSHDLVDNGGEHDAIVMQLLNAIRLRLKPVDSIMERLDQQTENSTTGWNWCIYSELKYLDLSSALFQGLFKDADKKGAYKNMVEFYDDVGNGTLPAYSFIEPRYFTNNGSKHNDMHPCGVSGEMAKDFIQAPVWLAQQLMLDIYEALFINAPAEKQAETLFIVTMDEAGGGYDHMPPPLVTPPNDSDQPKEYCNQTSPKFCFQRLGTRVPTLLISPRIKPGTVLRPVPGKPYDHSSLVASIGRRWGPNHTYEPMTDRDRNAPDFWHVGSVQVNEPVKRRKILVDSLREYIDVLDKRFRRYTDTKTKPNGTLEEILAVADQTQETALLTVAQEAHRLSKLVDIFGISMVILILTFLSWWYEFKFMPFSKYLFMWCLALFTVGLFLYQLFLHVTASR